jgi:hypothetical protein
LTLYHPANNILVMPSIPLRIFLLAIVFGLPSTLHADYLKNTDFKSDLSCWHGDGQRVFLKADGTEGAETDQGVTPVIRLTLSEHPQAVYQEFDTPDKPATMHIKVDIFASSDYKRSDQDQDYNRKWNSGGTYYAWRNAIPTADFWIRGGGVVRFFYKLSDATPGSWVTVEGNFKNLEELGTRSVTFCVPAGAGTLYLKNPLAEP